MSSDSHPRKNYDGDTQKYPEGYTRDGVSRYYSRLQESAQNPKLTVPRLRIGQLSDLAVSQDTFVHQGNFDKRYRGLREYIRTTVPETEAPCYIFDQHNNAFFAWAEALKEGKISPGATLIHIDSHGDEDWGDAHNFQLDDLESVARYTQKLKIYNFIGAGLRSGIIGDVIWINPFNDDQRIDDHASSKSIIPYLRVGLNHPIVEAFSNNLDSKQIIVDFDVDYFQPFFDDSEALAKARQSSDVSQTLSDDLNRVQTLIKRAGLVTVATSPEFIDQPTAIELTQRVLE